MATNLKVPSKTGADNFNLQDFIDDFNTIKTKLDGLTAGTGIDDKGIIKAKLEQSVQTTLDSINNKADKTTDFTKNIALTGWRKLPDGTIEQWGRGGFSVGEGSKTIIFPIVFPNSILHVDLCFTGSSTTNPTDLMYSTSADGPDKDKFNVYYNKPRNEYQGFMWRVIGY